MRKLHKRKFARHRKYIEKGIDINCKSSNGWNVLFFLFTNYKNENLLEIVRLLVEKRVDVNSKDCLGRNALFPLCVMYRNENLIDIVQLLVKNGIDVYCKDSFGNEAISLLLSNFKHKNLNESDFLSILDSTSTTGRDINLQDAF